MRLKRRKHSLRGPARPLGAGATALMALATAVLPVEAAVAQPQSIPHPQLDTSQLGQVGIVGAFSGLSTINYVGENSILRPVVATDEIISQSLDQPDAYLSTTLVDGTVKAACVLGDGKTAIIAGNFTTIRNTTAQGIARLDLDTGNTSSLAGVSLSGAVETLYCNGSQVWVGGSFQLGDAQGVGVWDNDASTWNLPAFGGFDLGAVVNSIVPFDNTLVFGGSFGNPLTGTSNVSANSNTSIAQPIQEIGLGAATASAQGGADGANPNAILCPNSGGWEAESGSRLSQITVNLARSVYPRSMNLYNLPTSDGTSLFRLVTLPSNSIMNLTYTNTSTGQQEYCDAWCPLPPSSEAPSVQFSFVDEVATTNLTFSLLDYYGDHAGLGGLSLDTDYTIITANNALNAPRSCQNIKTASSASVVGNWNPVSDYMDSVLTSQDQFQSTYVRYYPNVTDIGNYTLDLYTPGCATAGTCSQRGEVNVTVYPGATLEPVTLTLYQTNNELKYDQVFNGTLDGSSGFQPYVEVRPVPGQSTPFDFTALQLRVIYTGSPGISIQNLFQFSSDNYTQFQSDQSFKPVGRTILNQLGPQLGEGSSISSLLNVSNSLYIAGNISNSSLSNFVVYSTDNTTNGGLNVMSNAPLITKLAQVNGTSFAISDNAVFNITSANDLKQIVNNSVASIVPFNLNGNATLAFSPSNGNYNSSLLLWDYGTNQWYDQKAQGAASVSGHLSYSFDYSSTYFYFGSVMIQSSAASGSATVDANLNVVPQPFTFASSNSSNSSSSSSSRRRRRDTSDQTVLNSIYSGAYYNSSLSFMGGQFHAQTNDGVDAYNIIAVAGNGSFAFPAHDFGTNGVIYSLAISGNKLFIGGEISGQVGSTSITGVAVYDVDQNTFNDTQPAQLNSVASGSVVTVKAKNDSNTVAVMGSFGGAGDIVCHSFCIYTQNNNSWSLPGTNVVLDSSSKVVGGEFISTEELVIIGNLTISNGTAVPITTYDFSRNTFYDFAANNTLPGYPEAITIGYTGSGNVLVVVAGVNSTGGQYLTWWTNTTKTWTQVPTTFGSGTQILSTKLMPVVNGTGTGFLGSNQLLAVSGIINLPSYGDVSTSTYNGNDWQPLFVATNGANTGVINTLYSEKQFVLPVAPLPITPRPPRKLMPIGHVVGISFAIAVGCVSLIVIIGLLWSYFSQTPGYEVPSLRGSEKIN